MYVSGRRARGKIISTLPLHTSDEGRKDERRISQPDTASAIYQSSGIDQVSVSQQTDNNNLRKMWTILVSRGVQLLNSAPLMEYQVADSFPRKPMSTYTERLKNGKEKETTKKGPWMHLVLYNMYVTC